jgi:preprotein translocase SecE subunit
VARNRKRANRRSTRPPRPPGPGSNAAGPLTNGRAEVDAQEPLDDGLEPGLVGSDEPETVEPEALEPEPAVDDGLEPIDLEATNIPPIDLGLDTGVTAEQDIATGAERSAEDEARAAESDGTLEGAGLEGEEVDEDEDVDDEEDVDEEELEEFLEEHPEDAADTDLYEDPDDVEADADTDYDEDGVPDDVEPGAVATLPSGRRRRPARERKQAETPASTDVAAPRAALPFRLAHFLQGSWRELQRVQWPDRRQVMQATGVVVGFVIVAGAFLGVADYLSTKLINFILG